MRKLIGEIHRRSLWQVLGIYVAGSWMALQVVNEVVDSVALPDWISGAAVVLLIVGFPIVLATAFVQEGVGAGRAAEAPVPATGDGPSVAEPSREVGAAPAASPRPSGRSHRVLTWRNAIFGGVGALILLVLAVGAYVATRSLGVGPAATLVAKGVLEERDRILLADFTNRTNDEQLARVVTEALRVDLAGSNAVRLAEQSLIAQALDRMERPADTPVDGDLARLLAQREGIKAVLTGEIGQVGSNYVVSAQLVEPAGGEILFSHRENASSLDDIIEAIDRLSGRLRERIGESLGSIRAAPPLERVTTSDLEALRLYTQAVRAIEFDGESDRGIALLEEAVAIDTAFAAAYRKIGVTLGNRFEQRDRLVDAIRKAYAHRDRLTTSERYMTVAAYHTQLTGDMQAVVTAYENLLEADPTYYPALNNLGITYYGLRDPARAEELYTRAAAVELSSPFPLMNSVWPQALLGRMDDAYATLDTLEARFPGYPRVPEYRGKLASLQGDYEAASDDFGRLLEQRSGDLFYRGLANRLLGSVAATRGRLTEAERYIRESESANEARGVPAAALGDALVLGWIDLLVRRDTIAAASRIGEALARHPLESLPAADRPYLALADLAASMGDGSTARGYVGDFEETIPVEQRARGGGSEDLLQVRGRMALLEGRPDEAIELFRQSDTGGCYVCALPYLADAYAAAGMTDSTIAVLDRYVNMNWVDRVYWDSTELARSLETLGRLHEERGEAARAAEYYARFVELWADADEELQPRVRAAQTRLDAIMQEIG